MACSFSGAKDSEPGVVDYDTWRMYASSVVDSTRLCENERKRILIDSLLRPALDIATTLDATKTSQDLLHGHDHHYGEVSDGYEVVDICAICIMFASGHSFSSSLGFIRVSHVLKY